MTALDTCLRALRLYGATVINDPHDGGEASYYEIELPSGRAPLIIERFRFELLCIREHTRWLHAQRPLPFDGVRS